MPLKMSANFGGHLCRHSWIFDVIFNDDNDMIFTINDMQIVRCN